MNSINNIGNYNNYVALYQVHEHVKEDIWTFVELYRLIKAAGMDLKHVKKTP